ncbi:MAG: exonuclease domain-containing protein [Aestuariivirga sp.]
MAFIFYDTETTGSDPYWDQILQFAAIKTDDELNPIDRFEVRCRLQPHIVPAPGALVVTGVTVDQLSDLSAPSHYEMVRAVRAKLLSWSPATFVGYNSLEFDEVLLREALYQTLHPPYLTVTNGNSRADVMQLVLAVEQFWPGVLEFRQRFDGKPSFRLDQVAPANGFAHEHAHDAPADVEATIFIARLIRAKARDFWDHMIRLGSKSAAIDYALAEPLQLYTEFNHNRPHHWIVSPFAVDPDRSGRVIAFDLAISPEEVSRLDDDALHKRMVSPPKPLRPIKANSCPFIQPWTVGKGRVEACNLGETELRRRAALVHADVDFRRRLLKAYVQTKVDHEPSAYVEMQIYDGFASSSDQKLMETFHSADWTTRLEISQRLEDRRYRLLASRLVYFERPDTFDAAVRSGIEKIIAGRLLNSGKVPWLTLSRAIDDAESLLETANGPDIERLRDLEGFLKSRQAWAATVIDIR